MKQRRTVEGLYCVFVLRRQAPSPEALLPISFENVRCVPGVIASPNDRPSSRPNKLAEVFAAIHEGYPAQNGGSKVHAGLKLGPRSNSFRDASRIGSALDDPFLGAGLLMAIAASAALVHSLVPLYDCSCELTSILSPCSCEAPQQRQARGGTGEECQLPAGAVQRANRHLPE